MSIVVGDIEAYLNENNEFVFYMGGVYDGKDYKHFENLKDYFLYIIENYEHIYFHNLDFDILFFMREKWFNDFINNGKIITSGNLMITLQLTESKKSFTFKNSLTLLQGSLKNIVNKFLGINNRKWENQKSNVLDLEKEELSKYMRLDVVYLYMALEKMLDFSNSYGIKKLPLTVPSLALKIFIKNYETDYNSLFKSGKNKDFFENGFYYGGHTEKFYSKKYIFRNVRYYDVNSLYPFIMRDLKVTNNSTRRIKPSINKLKSLIKKNMLFYCEVKINIDSEMLRAFPMKDEEGKTFYKFGLQTIKMSENGIKFILKYGSWENIKEVKQLLLCEGEKITPFKNYVVDFYNIRKKTKYGVSYIAKLLLNSLYGKFGQNRKQKEIILNGNAKNVDMWYESETGLFFSIGHNTDVPIYREKFIRFDIAGKITEGARLYMQDIINQERQRGNKIYYMDTDSIICSKEIDKNLIDSEDLGKLKDEIGYKDNIILLGQKMYHFYKSGKKATKGVRNMNLNDFREYLRGKTEFENERFTKRYSLVVKGFFGIMRQPYEIRKIRERLDEN